MKLHSLVRSKGLKDKLNRRGRGNASGRGNFSGRGCNGQKSRSGHSMKPFFEGGQTSVVQRMPKARGFKRYYKLVDVVEVVNLSALEKDVRITSLVNKDLLVDLGYIHSNADRVKVLGNGELSKSLSFEGIELFSDAAKAKIEKAGGSIK
ncbi:MAG: 50S ribosomal protein L15 [candidate division SR1 bacterium]|nr:MAG: 50S ribosomal protein L15 [candidate division SR1 bacterium]